MPGFGDLNDFVEFVPIFQVLTDFVDLIIFSVFTDFAEFWTTRESFGMARGLRFWALGVDSGPRGGAVEGILDPQILISA